ncbi:MAG: heparinase II/III family protein, partial [Planctomycetes bacterium]|nr:heparinase II/III family protein [Planctomycetota bacterium]
ESSVRAAPQMFWFARAAGRPVYADFAAAHATGGAGDLLWYSPERVGPRAAGLPLDVHYRGIEVAFLRSAWEDPAAVYVGFKGGDNSENHSHLDLGTFTLDGDGRRWALDLGRDDYALPHYFTGGKGKYYRLKTVGHNTLVIDGKNHWGRARAPIVAFGSAPDEAFAVADLAAAWEEETGVRARRGVALRARRDVLVQDELAAARPVEAVWQMHTRAEVALGADGRRAELRQGGKVWHAIVVEPAGAAWTVVEPAAGPAPENANAGVRKLTLRLALPAGATRIAVWLARADRPAPAAAALRPLAEWGQGGEGK